MMGTGCGRMALMPRLILLFIALFAFGPGRALAESPADGAGQDLWSVELSVWSGEGAPSVSVNLAGESLEQNMQPGDDGAYHTILRVPQGRVLPVQFRLPSGAVQEDLVVLDHGDQEVHWLVTKTGELQRSSASTSQESVALREALTLAGGALWVLMTGLLLLSGRLERHGRQAMSWRVPEPVWLLVWLGLSVAFTWPAILSSDTMVVGRHFDAPGTVWVIGAASRLFGNLDPLTAWPLGADLSRLDSYLLVPIATLFEPLGAGRIFGLIGIFGVALNAWAAQHFARAIGVRSPWTVLAGFGYGFCGMAATGLLEGHVYQVFNPWLPWFGMFVWHATQEDGSSKQAWLASLMFALCWLTSAYVGLMALALGLAILAVSARRPRFLLGPSLVFLVAYVAWYMHGDASAREALEPLNPMSAHLAGLLAATPEMDRAEHSMAPIVFGWMLGLAVLSRRVLPSGRWRALLWTALGAGLCSLIPRFAASPDFVLLPINLEWLTGPVAGMLRFPIRWAWLWSLCGGLVAAKTASALAPRWGRLGWLVLTVVVAESFIRVGTPYRQESRYIGSPDVIAESPGAVLELLPITEDRGENHDRWLSNFACIEQLGHGQAIAEDCVHAKPRRIRQQLNFWLHDRLLRGQVGGVENTLASLGFKTVMMRPALFASQDMAVMISQLRSVDDDPVWVQEKGVHAWLFTLDGPQAADVASTLHSLMTPQQPKLSQRQWIGSSHHGRFNGWVGLLGWLLIVCGLGFAVKKR
jgi:hypothetical protein